MKDTRKKENLPTVTLVSFSLTLFPQYITSSKHLCLYYESSGLVLTELNGHHFQGNFQLRELLFFFQYVTVHLLAFSILFNPPIGGNTFVLE